jgi:hypothetical protein
MHWITQLLHTSWEPLWLHGRVQKVLLWLNNHQEANPSLVNHTPWRPIVYDLEVKDLLFPNILPFIWQAGLLAEGLG